jgi:DNA repair exonuclease SbcCD nuclease subunit
MIRGISTSDWHLSGGLTRIFPLKALEKQMAEIEKVFKYAVENDIRHVFMPGDMSDKARLDEATFIALVTLLMRYDKYLSFYYLLGNHDVAQVGKTSMDVLKVFAESGVFKNVHLFSTPETVEIEGVNVGFVPFPHTALPKSKKPRLIFAHVEEPGAMGDYGTPLKSATVKVDRSERDFVISGHLHTYQVLKQRRIIYNGALYQKTFGESPNKGFIEFQAKYNEGELLVKHKFINSQPNFRLDTIKIEDSRDWEQLEKGEHVFYRIYLGEGVVTPKDIVREYPNIVQINGTTYRGKAVVEDKVSADSIPKITPLTGLIEFLHQYELSKTEMKKAVGIVKDAIQQLGE